MDYNRIISQKNTLAIEILDRMYIDDFIDSERKEKAIKDIEWTILYVVQSMALDNKSILMNFFAWMRELFKTLSIDEMHLELLFVNTKTVLTEKYGNQVSEFLKDIDINKSKYSPYLLPENELYDEMVLYRDYLLSANKEKAKEIIDNLVDKGVSIEKIYINVFQEALRYVGEYWLQGKITVAMEHYFTAMTQYIMSTLYNLIFSDTDKSKKILACAIGSELHEVGIRMVADIFEMNGWDARYLGANVPLKDIIKYAEMFEPDIIALSVTMSYHIFNLRETVNALKANELTKKIKIIVGGIPFNNNQDLYKKIGADGYAKNAVEGVIAANELLR